LVVVRELAPGESFDPAAAMRDRRLNLAAVVTGSPAAPVLTGPSERIQGWRGPVGLLAAEAQASRATAYPAVQLAPLALATTADQSRSRMVTAQLGQTVLFLLTMLLAGMVLSNLVEEKGNKIIEVLAAAIPMDAVFLGKLFAMLAVSLVGIVVWASVGGAVWLGAGGNLANYPAPVVLYPWHGLFRDGIPAARLAVPGNWFDGDDRARSADAVDAGHYAPAAQLLLRFLRDVAPWVGNGAGSHDRAVQLALCDASAGGTGRGPLAPRPSARLAGALRDRFCPDRRQSVPSLGDEERPGAGQQWPGWIAEAGVCAPNRALTAIRNVPVPGTLLTFR
jgi:hypothetical protein